MMNNKGQNPYKTDSSPISPNDENSKLCNDKNGFNVHGNIVGDEDIEESDESQAFRQAESLHLACKALLLLVRHRGSHLKVRTYFHVHSFFTLPYKISMVCHPFFKLGLISHMKMF